MGSGQAVPLRNTAPYFAPPLGALPPLQGAPLGCRWSPPGLELCAGASEEETPENQVYIAQESMPREGLPVRSLPTEALAPTLQ